MSRIIRKTSRIVSRKQLTIELGDSEALTISSPSQSQSCDPEDLVIGVIACLLQRPILINRSLSTTIYMHPQEADDGDSQIDENMDQARKSRLRVSLALGRRKKRKQVFFHWHDRQSKLIQLTHVEVTPWTHIENLLLSILGVRIYL